MAGPRARHPRRSPPITCGSSGGGEKDSQHPEVHARRQVRAADRPARPGHRQQRHAESRRGGAHARRSRRRNELFVADGYVNHRVIVFDATTGALQASLGCVRQAAGRRLLHAGLARSCRRPFAGAVQHENKPSQYDPDGPPPPQFRIVHAVRISHDGLVYVCDRTNDRIQVFQKDGTFVQRSVHRETTLGSGSVWDIALLERSRPALPDRARRHESTGVDPAARHARGRRASSAAPATGRASSTARTTSPPIQRATSTSPRRTKGSACRSSSTKGSGRDAACFP